LYLVKRSLSTEIFSQVSNGITFNLHGGSIPRETGGGSGINTDGMIHKVGSKGGILNLGILQISGKLMNNGADHLQMSQFFCTWNWIKMKYDPGRF